MVNEYSTSNENQYTEANGYLNLFNHQNIPTIGDGNCWLRTLSLFFEGVEDNYKEYRQKIYEHAIMFKEDLRPFLFKSKMIIMMRYLRITILMNI